MLSYLLLLSYVCLVFSFEPPCYSCKFYIPHQTTPDLGLCRMFRDYINVKKELDKLFSKYVYTIKNLESDECSVDRHYNIVDSQPRNKILIEINIEKKRKMSERIYNYFHTIFT